MNDRTRSESFAGRDAKGEPVRARGIAEARPLVDWNDNCGCVTMTCNAPLRRYLLSITDGGNTISRFNTFVFESSAPTDPWRPVTYLRHFGERGYFVSMPSKFVSKNGRTVRFCCAANFTNGYPGTRFRGDPTGSR